jgi:hypothetical protein
MPPQSQKTAAAGRLSGDGRVSTDEQGTDPQRDDLGAAGCATILEEHASGAERGRPVLARLLRDIAAGETLVVVRPFGQPPAGRHRATRGQRDPFS